MLISLRQNRTRVNCRATSVGAGAAETQKFHRPRTGPVVVQFTTEACALCPDATLKIEARRQGNDLLLLGGYSHDQLSQKRL